MSGRRRRLEHELVERGIFASEQEARLAISARIVLVNGAPALSSATLVRAQDRLSVKRSRQFASRGGTKLAGAIADTGLSVTGKRCLDVGTGPGGFTDCLLQKGAAQVVAVDVAYGQFDWSLRNDERVVLIERTNVRSLTKEQIGGEVDLVVADVSFMSLGSICPLLVGFLNGQGQLLLMVKPQHEALRKDVPSGGIVTDARVWKQAILAVTQALAQAGAGTTQIVPSRLKGAEGNQEFFVLAAPSFPVDSGLVERALESIS